MATTLKEWELDLIAFLFAYLKDNLNPKVVELPTLQEWVYSFADPLPLRSEKGHKLTVAKSEDVRELTAATVERFVSMKILEPTRGPGRRPKPLPWYRINRAVVEKIDLARREKTEAGADTAADKKKKLRQIKIPSTLGFYKFWNACLKAGENAKYTEIAQEIIDEFDIHDSVTAAALTRAGRRYRRQLKSQK